MKLIIKCLTGISCQYNNQNNTSNPNQEALLFGPFKPMELIARTSNVNSEYKSTIKCGMQGIYILYLRNCNQGIIHQTNIRSIMTTMNVLNDDKNIIPSIISKCNKEVHLFCFSNQIQIYPVYKIFFEEDSESISIWPIIIENIKNPCATTNKTLNIAFHHILDRKKKDS